MSDFTNPLCHCPHRTKNAPCSRLIQNHHNQANQCGRQHQTVETKAELYHPIRYCTGQIRPIPGNPDCPEQFYHFPQRRRPCCYKLCLKLHIPKHCQEENQKSIPEPLWWHPARCTPVSGTLPFRSHFSQKLSSAAIPVTESFIPVEKRKHQWYTKINHPQPGKEDIEKSQNKIQDCPEPQILMPFFMHCHLSSRSANVIQPTGQFFPHSPQPTQIPLSTCAWQPFLTEMAYLGQECVHSPHATHRLVSTIAYFLDFIDIPPSFCLFYSSVRVNKNNQLRPVICFCFRLCVPLCYWSIKIIWQIRLDLLQAKQNGSSIIICNNLVISNSIVKKWHFLYGVFFDASSGVLQNKAITRME